MKELRECTVAEIAELAVIAIDVSSFVFEELNDSSILPFAGLVVVEVVLPFAGGTFSGRSFTLAGGSFPLVRHFRWIETNANCMHREREG